MARLSGTVSRYQDRECADTHRSCDLHISHSREVAGPQLDFSQTDIKGAAVSGLLNTSELFQWNKIISIIIYF